MKRPFAVFCAVIAALSVLRYAAGHPDRDGPLRETAALLCREAEDAGSAAQLLQAYACQWIILLFREKTIRNNL